MLRSLRLALISSVFALGSLLLMFALLGAAPSRSAVAAPTATFTVNSTSDAIDANPGNGVCQTSTAGQCTLRAAIMEANALPGADTIIVPAGTYNLLRPGNDDTAVNGDLDITSTLTISGAGYANTIIDGVGFMTTDRIFQITGTIDVAIMGVTIRGGKPQANNLDGNGGGLYNYNGRVTLTGVRVYTNTASWYGGGLASFGSTSALTLNQSVIDTNLAGFGGGLYIVGAPVTLNGSQLTGNIAIGGFLSSGLGGGAFIANANPASVSIRDGVITGNRAADAAGLYVSGGRLQLANTQVMSNVAGSAELFTGDGGGVYFVGSNPANDNGSISDSLFLSNTATSGGGLYLSNIALTLTHTSLIGNSASDGAAILLGNGQLIGTDNVITHNIATYNGGGLQLNSAHVSLTNTQIAHNAASTPNTASGAGIMLTGNTDLSLTGGSLSDNTAGGNGGGLYVDSTSRATLTYAYLGNNSATQGGGLYVRGSVIVTGSTLNGNDAQFGGGAVVSTTGQLTLTRAFIQSNYATHWGGGLYADGGTIRADRSFINSNGAARGAGVYFNNSASTIVNSTFSYNFAGEKGGAVYQGPGAAATIEQSTLTRNGFTFAGNGAGLYVVPTNTLSLRNTLVANSSMGGNAAPDCEGPITSQDYNLIENPAGCIINGVTMHNLTGLDPKLDAVAYYGGGTWTFALLAGSPARDKIPANLCPDVDQRGVKRPQGAACDIGAFEAELKLYLPLALR